MMDVLLDAIFPNRSAEAALRGYLFQVYWSVERWIDLAVDEVLLCEGDEDLDRLLRDVSGRVHAIHEQFKDLQKPVSGRSEAVYTSVFNFLVSFHVHHAAGRRAAFVFTTSATLAEQRVSNDRSTTKGAYLPLDVLRVWREFTETAAPEPLVAAIKELVAFYGPGGASGGDGGTVQGMPSAEQLAKALTYLDAEPARWTEFLLGVRWNTGQEAGSALVARLEERVARDSRTQKLPAKVMLERLVFEALQTSARPNRTERLLTTERLHALAEATGDELGRWAADTHAYRLSEWFLALDERFERVHTQLAHVGGQLQDHDERLQSIEKVTSPRERLLEHSRAACRHLSRFASISVNGHTIGIHRQVVSAMIDMALARSFVVVGEPGAGKSGALFNLVEQLEAGGYDTVCLLADDLPDVGVRIASVLSEWSGERPGILVIDALDAARGEATAVRLRRLVEEVLHAPGRWRVVASIRTFDLRADSIMARAFRGTPHAVFHAPEFARTSHVSVGPLDEGELAELEKQSAVLGAVLQTAPPALKELLRIPFNLTLAAELLESGLAASAFSDLRSSLDLLDLYWRSRVEEERPHERRYARERLLHDVCALMIRGRTLRASTHALSQADGLYDLLHAHILVHPRRGSRGTEGELVFGHHILFDYAVARVWLSRQPQGLARQLLDDPDLVLVVRPSLGIYFRLLWQLDPSRDAFWAIVLRIAGEPNLRPVGQIIGPTVVAEVVSRMDDLAALCRALSAQDERKMTAGERALRHMVSAFLALPRERLPMVGKGAGPWCELAKHLSGATSTVQRAIARLLLEEACKQPESLTLDQLEHAGVAARALFRWAQTFPEPWLAGRTIVLVCRTFSSDPMESECLLREITEPAYLQLHGHAVLSSIAQEVGRLIPRAPAFVEGLYVRAFENIDTSESVTLLGGAATFQLTSNRRQDYNGGLYLLAVEKYEHFLNAAPEHATRAMIRLVELYVDRSHYGQRDQQDEYVLDLDGHPAKLRPDGSAFWDEDDHRYENELKVLSAWGKYLIKLADQPEGAEILSSILEAVFKHNHRAGVWRRLLKLAAKYPAMLGYRVRALLWQGPILSETDTTYWAAECLKTVFPLLDAADRARVERAVLATQRSDSAVRTRNRLLGCIPVAHLVTDDARDLQARLAAEGALPPNTPPFQMSGWKSRKLTREDRLDDLAREGVPVDAVPNRRIHDLMEPVEAFADLPKDKCSLTDIERVLPTLATLYDSLLTADKDGVHPRQRDAGWAHFAEACQKIVEWGEIDAHLDLLREMRVYLVSASESASPVPNPTADAHFDEVSGWGSPSARISAASGLCTIAWFPEYVDDAMLKVIDRLGREDSVPAVRYQVAARLLNLYKSAPDFGWRLAEHGAHEEPSGAVVQALVAQNFGHLADLNLDRTAQLTVAILNRLTAPAARVKGVRETCTRFLADLYIWLDQPLAGEMVSGIVARPPSPEAMWLCTCTHDALTHGPTDNVDSASEGVRRRAREILMHLVQAALSDISGLQARRRAGQEPLSKDEDERERQLCQLLNDISNRLYFASGSYEKGQDKLSLEQRRRFYNELGPVFDQLTMTGMSGVSHHLAEMFEHQVDFDPAGVLRRLAQVVRMAKDGGYQHDSLAVTLYVRLATRYLADYRDLLQDDESCRRDLLDILDAFVEAGWPAAWSLTYSLQDIFR